MMLYPLTGFAPPPSLTFPSGSTVQVRPTGLPGSASAGPNSANHLANASMTV